MLSPRITDAKTRHNRTLTAMDSERSSWFTHWRELSEYFLPRRYPSLSGIKESTNRDQRNRKLLDSTSVISLNILAAGLMNGITSPSRKWFNLSQRGRKGKGDPKLAEWFDETRRVLFAIFSESNFYDSIAVLYHEWCTFGTASMTVREDYNDVIRCYNHPAGEYFLSVDNTGRVNRHARRFEMTLEQMVKEFGVEKLSLSLREAYRQGAEKLFQTYTVSHIIEEATNDGLFQTNAKYREVFWRETGGSDEGYLAIRPLYEWPGIHPRWEKLGNSPYGVAPTMDALGDTIQLQHLKLRQGQGLDKLISPPLIVDQQLRNRPKALSAGGLTYAPNLSANFGAKPLYAIQMPFQELAMVGNELRERIQECLYNPLFNMISQLDTVRSATEIDARREEKLIQLSSVLERFYNEGLTPLITRVYGIAKRAGLIPPLPEGFENVDVEISFVSILSDAQKASDVSTIERFFTFAGSLAAVFPDATRVPEAQELLRQYAEGLGIRPNGVRSQEKIDEIEAAEQQQQQLAQTAAIAKDFGAGAASLGKVDVGGGMNAARALMG